MAADPFLLRTVGENLSHAFSLSSDGLLAASGIPWHVSPGLGVSMRNDILFLYKSVSLFRCLTLVMTSILLCQGTA